MSFSLLGVFGAGLATFLSPCLLPMVPIMTASLLFSEGVSNGDTEGAARFARLRAALWFVLGFTTVFVLMGLGLSALAPLLGAAKPALLALGGLVFALFGLKMMGTFEGMRMSRSFHFPDVRAYFPKGLHGLVFGMIFGLSWTPCVGPVLGGVLTYVASREREPGEGALLLLAFSLGISLPFLAFAAASDRLTPFLGKLKRHLPKIEYAMGLGLLLFGAYTIQQSRFLVPEFREVGDANRSLSVLASTGERIQLSGPDVAKDTGVAKMLFFYSDRCPVCRAMEGFLPAVEKSCEDEKFRLVRVDVDRPENYLAASFFNVRATPTVSLLSGSGTELVRLVGFQTEGRLIDAARRVSRVECSTRAGSATGLANPPKDPFPAAQPVPGEACTAGSVC